MNPDDRDYDLWRIGVCIVESGGNLTVRELSRRLPRHLRKSDLIRKLLVELERQGIGQWRRRKRKGQPFDAFYVDPEKWQGELTELQYRIKSGHADDLPQERRRKLKPAEESKLLKENIRGKRSLAEMRQHIKVLERELEAERADKELLLALEDSPTTVGLERRAPKKGKPNNAVSVGVASDWHVEEKVELEETNFRNRNDLEFSEIKMARYFRAIVKLVRREQEFYDIRTHVQAFIGDLLTGHIHDELVEVSEVPPMEVVLWLYPRLIDGLRMLTEELDVDKILVVCKHGNHGRDGKKPRIAGSASHNYEYLLWKMIAQTAEREEWGEKVDFVIETSYLTYVDLGGYEIAFHHGDGLKYGGGIGGLTIPLAKAIKAWRAHRHADLFVGGHFHTIVEGADFVQNGSLIGPGPYSIQRVRSAPEPPQQVFFVVDTDRRQKVSSSVIHVLTQQELEDFGWV